MLRGVCCHFPGRHLVLWLTGTGPGQAFGVRPG